ncbi:MAG: c-type cytochrome domain-containing protein [Bacteroidota bacterium]
MKVTPKGFAENLLFALNVFIVFLLVFGSKIAVATWLMPVGRMHPLLLHFPIVILMLAMVLESFRFKAIYQKESLYQTFTTGLLLVGSLLAAVTVIMGLFLSKEQGYAGSVLDWHKWTGVSIVFLASLIYWKRNAGWYRAPAARLGALLITFGLVLTGHYGATLTHGDNFVLEPVTPVKAVPKVPIADALVFQDVIMPIFSQKCLNCHNLDKAKGGLVMVDGKSMLKGGKSGALFVPGQPEISLLLQRIHLPATEKKHMPPKDEAQLTDDELALINLWVKQNAEMKKKVVELPEQDSLRILAAVYLTPTAVAEEEDFDFSAASETDIKKLNNNYRVIYPYAKNSPALGVNIYNKATFKADVLKELDPIKKQIVSLTLSGMPVTDEMLKIVARFKNLRKLNLNYTLVRGQGLKYLQDLKNLKALTLSGTSVNYQLVNEFVKSSNLQRLSLWETQVNTAQLKQLQKQFRNISFEGGFNDDGKVSAKLNQPKLNVEGNLFKQAFSLELKHVIRGVQIRYTLDGTEPDSLNSPLYKTGIPIQKNTLLKTRAFKKGWISSDLLSIPLYRNTYKPDSIATILLPEENLNGGRAPALIDGQFGSIDIFQGRWAGYIKNDFSTIMLYKQPVLVSSVALNAILHLGANALLPHVVEVWGGKDPKHLKLLGTNRPAAAKKDDPPLIVTMEVNFKPQQLSCIKILTRNVKKLPAWHPGKGNPAVLFVDEILVN